MNLLKYIHLQGQQINIQMSQPHLLTTLISNTAKPHATPIILLDTFIFYFDLIVHHIKESLIRMDELPLQIMTLHDLHIIGTHLSFISKLSCTASHNSKETTNGFKDWMDIQIAKLRCKLNEYEQISDRTRHTVDITRVLHESQQINIILHKILAAWNHVQTPKEEENRLLYYKLLQKTLTTQCAITHFVEDRPPSLDNPTPSDEEKAFRIINKKLYFFSMKKPGWFTPSRNATNEN